MKNYIKNIELLPNCLDFFKKNKKIILAAIPTTLLSFTLIGCGNQNTNTQETNENQEQPSNEVATQEEEANVLEEFNSYIEEKASSGSVVEASIGVMKDMWGTLKNAATDAWNSEPTQEALNQAFEEFDTLLGFLFNDEEVAGVKFSELSESGKEAIKNIFYSLDSKLNEWIPDYKERFKEWSIETGASGLNALNNITESLGDWRDQVIAEYQNTYNNEETQKTLTK